MHRISSLRAASTALASAVVFALGVATPSAQAQIYSEKLLYSFTGTPDGATPLAGLVRGAAGTVYGTTAYGGDPSCSNWQGNLCGTVFKLTRTGTESVLYSFTGTPDGATPFAGLVRDSKGNLYGTTYAGGVSGGCGSVFELANTGTESVLFSFTGGSNGCQPYAGLILDMAGNLYGTSNGGGPSGYGTVFKLDTSGNEAVLHFFAGPPDGLAPQAALVMDEAGNLYGTTYSGGIGYGTVFEVNANGTESVLYSFTGGADGGYPIGGLIRDSKGNLYGTTEYGGPKNGTCEGGDVPAGCGVVFKLDATGGETVLYSFNGTPDGYYPLGTLVRDSKGRLFGTTQAGGQFGLGTVFEVSQRKERVLHSFAGGTTDGASPYAGLVMDTAGNLYATTSAGGAFNDGTVFKLAPR